MSRRLLSLALLAGVAFATIAAPARALTYTEVNTMLADQVMIPTYRDFATATQGLVGALDKFCGPTPTAQLGDVKAAFVTAFTAWQTAQPIGFGPVTKDGRASIIEFWPDKHGSAGRQLAKALETRPEGLLDPAKLAGQSVALKSFTVLEQLLFDTASPLLAGDSATPSAVFACGYASSVAKLQSGIADAIVAEWDGPDGYREAMLKAGPGSADFFSPYDVTVEVLKSLSGGLDVIVQQKLERPLGEALDTAQPRRAESWRSARSLDNIRANLVTLKALYELPGGMGALSKALDADGTTDHAMRAQMAQALELVDAVGMPLEDAVADPAGRLRVEALLAQVKSLRALVGGPLAQSLAMSLGFNALDGD